MLTALTLALLLGSPPPAASRLSPQELQALVDEIGARVEQIRGLKFKTPVSMQVIDSAAARADFQSKIEAFTIEQARHAQNAYVHLGLVPAGTDLVRGYLERAEQDMLGYYDTREKKLFLMSHVDPHDVRGVIAHELTHALEDQNFDFTALGQKAESDDHQTAISAVIEGSAMVVMFTFIRGDARGDEAVERAKKEELKRSDKLRDAPSFVQQTAMLPYLLGFSFLLRGAPWNFADGVPWADLNGAYANPPRSTRQILHPEQYWWGQDRKQVPGPVLPDLSATLGPGWSKAIEGSIGELGLAVLTGSKLDIGSIQALLPQRWTHEAAAGTTGDVYQHYVNGDRKATVLLTQWETPRDAAQFGRALVHRGRFFMSYGVNVIVLAGDLDPSQGPSIASVALRDAPYWPR